MTKRRAEAKTVSALFAFLTPRAPAALAGRVPSHRRLATLVFALALASLALVGCKRSPATIADAGAPSRPDAGPSLARSVAPGEPDPWPVEATATAPVSGGTLRARLRAEPPHLNLLIQPDYATSRITLGLVFEALLEEDPKTGALRPGLATSWRVEEGGRRVVLALASDRRWHDGRPVTPDDVKWTLDTVLDPDSPAITLRANVQSLRRVVVRDGVLVLEYARPDYFALRALATIPILPRHVYGTGALAAHPANRAPVGSGPYRVAKWLAGREIELERAAKQGPPWLERVRFIVVRDDAIAALMIRRGELDLDERAGNDAWLAGWRDDGLRARALRLLFYPPGYAFRVYNTRHPALADARVREALTWLTDRATILREVHRGLHRATDSPYPAGSDCAAGLVARGFDPKRAAALLEAAGYGRGKTPLRLTWLIPSSSKTLVPEARIFAADARRVGVEIALETVDWATFQSRLRAGRFDLAALAFFTSPDDDLYSVFHSTQRKGGLNYGAYTDAALDRLLEASRVESRPAERLALCRQIARRLYDGQPFTFLYQLATPVLASRRVHGLAPSLTGVVLRDLWLSDAK